MKPVSSTNLKPVRTRRRMEIKIYFRIRSSQAKDLQPRPIMIRLTMDNVTITDYMSGVVVRPALWDQSLQMVKGRTKSADLLNEELSRVELTHREILRELKRRYARGEGQRPTPELVRKEFQKPGSASPSLLVLLDEYIVYLNKLCGSDEGKQEKTMDRVHKTRSHVRHFSWQKKYGTLPDKLVKKGEPDPSPSLLDITTQWGKDFHIWLQLEPGTQKRRMQKDSANKYLSHVRDALDFAIDNNYLATNRLNEFRPKRGKGKEVYFLEPEHIDRFMAMKSDDPMLSNVLWWCRLMALTGMDYKDAILYARHRTHYEKKTGVSTKIVINRQKGNYVCEIPLLPQVEVLFGMHPTGPHAPVLADLNRHLKVIQAHIKFNKPLTSKIMRKTAGAIFLRIGYTMAAVSKFLGHSSVRTTETYYLKVTSSYVDMEMERIRRTRIESAG